jgi:hypothetical protein
MICFDMRGREKRLLVDAWNPDRQPPNQDSRILIFYNLAPPFYYVEDFSQIDQGQEKTIFFLPLVAGV